MGLFDKKFCDVCGEKIGLLGNRKLSDGNICKDCANKLSPFFSERKQSTLEEIKEQLEYREANKAEVEAFNVTKMFSKSKYVFIDETKGNFMVNWKKDYKQDNPDVIPLSTITGVNVDVKSSKTEKKHADKDGKQISFMPPRFETSYDVWLTIFVKHKYFDEISFEISGDITIPTVGSQQVDPSYNPEYRNAMDFADELKAALSSASASAAEAAKPKQAVKCPHCGATTIPTANGCCEYCDGPLQ